MELLAYTSDYSSTGVLAGFSFGVIFFTVLITWVIVSIPLMVLFKKVGANPVAAWVPIWNMWTFFKVAGMNGAWVFIGFVPFLGALALAVLGTIAAYNIALGFRKENPALWTIGYFFFSTIWMYIIAFGSTHWFGVQNGSAAPVMFTDTTYQTPSI